MSRIVTVQDLRARLGSALDALGETPDALYMSKKCPGRESVMPPDRRLSSRNFAGVVA